MIEVKRSVGTLSPHVCSLWLHERYALVAKDELTLDAQRKAGDVEIAIDTDEDLSQAQLKERYEAQRASQSRVHVPGADVDRSGFDDVVSGEMKKGREKRRREARTRRRSTSSERGDIGPILSQICDDARLLDPIQSWCAKCSLPEQCRKPGTDAACKSRHKGVMCTS